MKKEKTDSIKLDKVTFEFCQEENCCSSEMGGLETLTIECMSDMGISDSGGAFYVLKTEQWAINTVEELAELLEKVSKAIDTVK